MIIKNIHCHKLDKNKKLLPLADYHKLAFSLLKKSNYYKKYYLYDQDLMANIATEIMIADSTFDPSRGVTLNAYRMSRINWEINKYVEFQVKESNQDNKVWDNKEYTQNSSELEECINACSLPHRSKFVLRQILLNKENYSNVGQKLKISGTQVKNILQESCWTIYRKYMR